MSPSMSFTTPCLVLVLNAVLWIAVVAGVARVAGVSEVAGVAGITGVAGDNPECECTFNVERNMNELLCVNKSLSTLPDLASYECASDVIDISLNNIMHVGNVTFSQAQQVRVVIMYRDGIRTIDNNAFYELQNLEEIDLTGNLLIDIYPDLFVNNHNLEKVILSRNPLFKISDKTSILNSPSVTHLELYGCDLQSINKEMFSKLRNLKHINLSDNKLKYIPADTFTGMHSLSIVEINHNDWSCDCNFQNLREFIASLRAKSHPLDKPQRPVRCYKENGMGMKTITAASKLLDCDGHDKYCSSIECEEPVLLEKLIQPTTEPYKPSSAITTDCIDDESGCAPGDCLTIQYSSPYVILIGGALMTIIITILLFIVKCCMRGVCCSSTLPKHASGSHSNQYNINIRKIEEQNMRNAKCSSKERLISTSSISSDNNDQTYTPIVVYRDQLFVMPDCPNTRVHVYDRIQTTDVNASSDGH